jgi:TPR repeat protein
VAPEGTDVKQEKKDRFECLMASRYGWSQYGYAKYSPTIYNSCMDSKGYVKEADGIESYNHAQQAAAQGNAEAQNNLGFLYAKGSGVPEDYIQAEKWYEKAAAQGNAEAQNRLGVLYDMGQGVPQNYAKARQWYEKAAAQGDAWAPLSLGLLYRDGHGVQGSLVRAYMWFSIAAARSTDDAHKDVAEFRDVVARHMTPAEIAEAQRLSQQCQAQQFKGC